MDPFDEWVKLSTQHVSVQAHADRLIELGATWDTFRTREAREVAADLVDGGVPPLAARDIVAVATKAAEQNQGPLAIFWDLENMPIPATSSGRDVSTRLKAILKPYGELVLFRGYASIGMNHIPTQKRSDLQLSGCLLVDCPHNGRKEVADKMIIVDAMNFAMNHPDGATLCFVTGDVDYAYMLAVLQRYKQYQTIVISKGTLQSMLDVNADMKMRWETDILQLRTNSSPAWINTGVDLSLISRGEEEVGLSGTGRVESDKQDDVEHRHEESRSSDFEALTLYEEWSDDIEFLKSLVRQASGTNGASSSKTVRKSYLGNQLRQTNPVRFPNREAVSQFLEQVVQKGIISESGEGAFKEVFLPEDETSGMLAALPLSAQLPIALNDIPDGVMKKASSLPYIIAVKWKHCPPGTKLPSHVFTQSMGSWGFHMFKSLPDCQRVVASDNSWLRNGILVDWRKLKRDGLSALIKTAEPANKSTKEEEKCSLCSAIRQDIVLVPVPGNRGSGLACPECVAWKEISPSDKRTAADKVVDYMNFLSRNDDIIFPESMLRKMIHLKPEYQCESRKAAALWIKHALTLDMVRMTKQNSAGSSKNKMIYLKSNQSQVSVPLPPEAMDTHHEESFVEDLLWTLAKEKQQPWMDRVKVNEALSTNFGRMYHPYMRTRVLMNAHQKDRFHLAKNIYGQAVALTKEDAEMGAVSLGHAAATDSNAEILDTLSSQNLHGGSSMQDNTQSLGEDDSESRSESSSISAKDREGEHDDSSSYEEDDLEKLVAFGKR